MSVDVNMANYQASQLRNYATQLNDVKISLIAYRNQLDANWWSDEIKSIDCAINKITNRIQDIQNKLNVTADNVMNSANQIRQEEIAAERRRQQEIARKRAQREAQQRAAEQKAAQEHAAAEQARKAEEERKAMDELKDKINKVKSKSKKNKLVKKLNEPGITSQELQEYFDKIMG